MGDQFIMLVKGFDPAKTFASSCHPLHGSNHRKNISTGGKILSDIFARDFTTNVGKSNVSPVYYYRQTHITKHMIEFQMTDRVFQSQNAILRHLIDKQAEDIIDEGITATIKYNHSRYGRSMSTLQRYLDLSRATIEPYIKSSHFPSEKVMLAIRGAAGKYPQMVRRSVTVHPAETLSTTQKADEIANKQEENTNATLGFVKRNYLLLNNSDLLDCHEEVGPEISKNNEMIDALKLQKKSIDQVYNAIVLDQRDEELIQSILQFRAANPNKPVHVIMGKAHEVPEKLAARYPDIPVIEPLGTKSEALD